jgi:hypothetical protein
VREEYLGALYCLGACITIFYGWLMFWHLLEQVGNIVKDFKDRKNKWR